MSSVNPHCRRAIIVVNYGSAELIRVNLAQLCNSAPDTIAVVVDNFKSEQDALAIHDVCANIGAILLARPDNSGFGAGVNAGADYALELGAEALLILNPDATMTPADATELFEAVEADPRLLCVPTMVDDDGKLTTSSGLLDLQTGFPPPKGAAQQPISVFRWLSGAALTVHRSMWETLGGIDEDYFMYWEDIDFCYRALRHGGHVRVMQDVAAIHSVGGTQSGHDTGAKSPLYIEYNCRNRLVFARKHLSHRLVQHWSRNAASYAKVVILRSGSKKYLAHSPSLRAAARGTWRGMHDQLTGHTPTPSADSADPHSPRLNQLASQTRVSPQAAPAQSVDSAPNH